MNELLFGSLRKCLVGPSSVVDDLKCGSSMQAMFAVPARLHVVDRANQQRRLSGEGPAAACELLGLDPVTVANEGKLVAVVAPEASKVLIAAMRDHEPGRDAALIGEVIADDQRFVQMKTTFGGGRIRLARRRTLPRIC